MLKLTKSIPHYCSLKDALEINSVDSSCQKFDYFVHLHLDWRLVELSRNECHGLICCACCHHQSMLAIYLHCLLSPRDTSLNYHLFIFLFVGLFRLLLVDWRLDFDLDLLLCGMSFGHLIAQVSDSSTHHRLPRFAGQVWFHLKMLLAQPVCSIDLQAYVSSSASFIFHWWQ